MTLVISDDMKTEWFPPDVKPVHPGRYEIGHAGEWCARCGYSGPVALAERCAVWNGKVWQHSWASEVDFDAPLAVQDRPWRGLKEPAKMITDDMKTEWFPASIQPTRPGYYEVRRFSAGGQRMPDHKLEWTGRRWEYCHTYRLSSPGDFAIMVPDDGDMWRGLKAPYEPAQEG